MTKRFAWLGAVLPVAMLIAAMPTQARAEGGKNIASAPLIAYGVHETGDTTNGGEGTFRDRCEPPYEPNLNSFWQLPVTVGDHVTLDWEAVIPSSTCVSVYPIGTNDFGVANVSPEETTGQTTNGKQEMKFTAPSSGNLIIDVAADKFSSGCKNCAGPYAFTATLQHSLSMTLAPPPSIPTNGIISATVTQNTGTPVPDGLVFWFIARWYEHDERKAFETTGVSTGGVVPFQLGLPEGAAGHELKLYAGRGEDAGYVEVASNSASVKAVLPPVVAPPVHRKRHHHRHHRRHHHHHHHHRH